MGLVAGLLIDVVNDGFVVPAAVNGRALHPAYVDVRVHTVGGGGRV